MDGARISALTTQGRDILRTARMVFGLPRSVTLRPKSVKSVILCTKDDDTLRALLAPFANVEVEVMRGIVGASESTEKEETRGH